MRSNSSDDEAGNQKLPSTPLKRSRRIVTSSSSSSSSAEEEDPNAQAPAQTDPPPITISDSDDSMFIPLPRNVHHTATEHREHNSGNAFDILMASPSQRRPAVQNTTASASAHQPRPAVRTATASAPTQQRRSATCRSTCAERSLNQPVRTHRQQARSLAIGAQPARETRRSSASRLCHPEASETSDEFDDDSADESDPTAADLYRDAIMGVRNRPQALSQVSELLCSDTLQP